MILQNLNFYIISSLVISALSVYFSIYSIILKPFRVSSLSFSIFSFITFIASMGTSMYLLTSNYGTAVRWFYVFYAGASLHTVSLFILITDFIGYGYKKVKEAYKYILYLIPLVLIAVIILFGKIDTVKTDYGYIFNISNIMKFIGPVYFTTASLVIILILSLELDRRNKVNRSTTSIITVLVGVVIYTLIQVVYQVLLSADLVTRIPSYIISTAPLYIFILISLFSIRANLNNISLFSSFEKIQDCILITDDRGNILEINNCMKKRLSLMNGSENMKTLKGDYIKSLISNRIFGKSSTRDYFNFLKSDSKDDYKRDLIIKDGKKNLTYNISVSPIFDKRNNILGRVSIFRDITQHAEYEKEIEYISFHDKLTGLYNRHYFEKEIKRFDTKRQLPISIIMADLDGLKFVNDKYGHKKGDCLIIAAAEIFKNSIRKEDVAARWGGDEFVVLLPKTSKEVAKKTINRIKQNFAGRSLDNLIPINISLGYATKSEAKQSIEKILERADKDMYINKNNRKKS